MKIPFLSFDVTNSLIEQEVLQCFEQFFRSKQYILGTQLQEFERLYSRYNEVASTVCVSNGLDALFLSLKLAGVEKGDEVIVPSNTYIASVLAVTYTGATPVFVEPDIFTYNIDPTKIEAAITAKTKAIMPVHLYGQSCAMSDIMMVAEKYGLAVVEDNAQAHGARWKGQLTGSWGIANGTSFYPGKNLGALGDAGAVTTNDASLAARAKVLRNYGSQQKYYNEEIGYNMRMDELQAGMLLIKLKYILDWTRQRQQIASWYFEMLKDITEIILPGTHEQATHVYHLFVIRTPKREALQAFLSANGIGTMIHYPVPPHLQNAYRFLGYQKGSFPLAEELASTSLSLPIWPGMKKEQVDFIANQIRAFFQ